MNIPIFITGLVLLLVSFVAAPKKDKAPQPKDRQMELRKDAFGMYWMYEYIEYPGWNLHSRVLSLEDGQRLRDGNNDRINRKSSDEVIVK